MEINSGYKPSNIIVSKTFKLIRFAVHLITIVLVLFMLLDSSEAPEVLKLFNTMAIFSGIILLLSGLSYREWFKLPGSLLSFKYGSVALICFYLISLVIDLTFDREVLEWDRAYLFENTLIAFTVSMLFAPIFEECLFRGYFYTLIDNIGSRFKLSINISWLFPAAITSIIFGLIHHRYDLIDQIFLMLVGGVFAYSRHVTGAIVVPFMLHSLASLLAFLTIYIKVVLA